MTTDKISRSRNYIISRTQNVLVNVRGAMGKLSLLPQDLEPINLAMFQACANIEELIARLEAARPLVNKKATSRPARPKRKGK
jgi:hypothetical protein